MSSSIREAYERYGVESFYTSHDYTNPHENTIRSLLGSSHKSLPLKKVLDLSAGNGLVTETLAKLGYHNVSGTDPFMSSAYEDSTGKECLPLSFKDIVKDGLPDKYSCVICSFALHLCEKSLLKSLLWRLSESTDTLVVISPTKFPVIGTPEVERFGFTPSNKRVHFRVYNLPIS